VDGWGLEVAVYSFSFCYFFFFESGLVGHMRVREMIENPRLFSSHELDYASRRIDGSKLILFWVKNIGHRDEMCDRIIEEGAPKDKAKFI